MRRWRNKKLLPWADQSRRGGLFSDPLHTAGRRLFMALATCDFSGAEEGDGTGIKQRRQAKKSCATKVAQLESTYLQTRHSQPLQDSKFPTTGTPMSPRTLNAAVSLLSVKASTGAHMARHTCVHHDRHT